MHPVWGQVEARRTIGLNALGAEEPRDFLWRGSDNEASAHSSTPRWGKWQTLLRVSPSALALKFFTKLLTQLCDWVIGCFGHCFQFFGKNGELAVFRKLRLLILI
jgi:hypothetical protein